jgi:hypothetical protein
MMDSARRPHSLRSAERQEWPRSETGEEDMLGMIATVLIVLWLLGFFAFHVTTGFIHIVLVAGIVLLILHFFTGRSAAA